MKNNSLVFLWLFGLCVCVAQAQAVVITKLELVERTPFVVGSSSVIDIVLVETRDPGDTSVIGTLPTVSANIRFSGSGSSSFIASNLVDHEIQAGRFFDNGGGSSIINQSGFTGTVEQYDGSPSATDDPLGTISSPTTATLRLASFTLSGGAVGESVTFTLEDFDSALDDIVLDDGASGIVLDGTIQFGSLTITGSSGGGGGVVPEPTSVALFGSLVGGLMLRRRKNRSSK
jgi:hypothetical protein